MPSHCHLLPPARRSSAHITHGIVKTATLRRKSQKGDETVTKSTEQRKACRCCAGRASGSVCVCATQLSAMQLSAPLPCCHWACLVANPAGTRVPWQSGTFGSVRADESGPCLHRGDSSLSSCSRQGWSPPPYSIPHPTMARGHSACSLICGWIAWSVKG